MEMLSVPGLKSGPGREASEKQSLADSVLCEITDIR